MSQPSRRWLRPRSVIFLGVLAVVAVIMGARRDRVYAPGQTLQYDDFFFTLRGVNRLPVADQAGTVESAARIEYVVKLSIENRARRVAFRFPDDGVALIDPRSGQRYHVEPKAQRAYDEATGQARTDPLVLKPGESATRAYVFQLPLGVSDPRLRVAPGGWSGLIPETILFGVKEFRLP